MNQDKTEGLPPNKEESRPTATINADLAAASAPGERKPGEDLKARQEKLLDEALEESFPGSDPISPSQIT
jgi:hypothetical protein